LNFDDAGTKQHMTNEAVAPASRAVALDRSVRQPPVPVQRGAAATLDPTGAFPRAGGDTLGRFMAWMERRDVPLARRGRYRAHADRYLEWSLELGPQSGAVAIQNHLAYLRRAGVDQSELAEVHIALSLFDLCIGL
jgi:hypothetical protein